MSASSTALLQALPIDERRGSGSMWLFIITETLLFVALTFAYFYLGRDAPHWPSDEPPKLVLATVMMIVLIGSSVIVMAAERAVKAGAEGRARGLVTLTLVLGVAFLALQFCEYREHLRVLKTTTDAYGSIFYTVTSVHGVHVLLGLCMWGFVLLMPRVEQMPRSPHRPLHNAGLYWHFVDIVWIAIVLLLYYLPHVHR